MRHEICRLPPPLFLRTCFNSTQKQKLAVCSRTSRTLQPALLMVHAFFITALDLKVAKVVRCTWRPSTSTNRPLIGSHPSVGSYRSRLIGRCAKTMSKLPLFADGRVPTGVTMAPKWPGAAPKGLTRTSVVRQFSTVSGMNYPRLSALKSSCSYETT